MKGDIYWRFEAFIDVQNCQIIKILPITTAGLDQGSSERCTWHTTIFQADM